MTNPLTQLQNDLQTARHTLLATLADFDEAQWETAVFSEGDTWTVLDVLRHVADSQHSMTRLMMKIRDTGEGVPDDFDLVRWNASRVSKARVKTHPEVLAQLEADQQTLFDFMASLDEADWEKRGRHGSGHIMSIAEICALIAQHELTHTADMQNAAR